jgi:hypothetical protein
MSQIGQRMDFGCSGMAAIAAAACSLADFKDIPICVFPISSSLLSL